MQLVCYTDIRISLIYITFYVCLKVQYTVLFFKKKEKESKDIIKYVKLYRINIRNIVFNQTAKKLHTIETSKMTIELHKLTITVTHIIRMIILC